MKRIISMLLICAATLTELSSCESSGIPTDTTTATNTSEETVSPTLPAVSESAEPTTEETEEFSGRSYVIEKPFDKEENLEVIFSEFCKKYKELYENGLDFQLEFRLYGKALTSEEVGNLNFYVYWDEEDGCTRIRFINRDATISSQFNQNVDEFTFEMFKELVDMEEVTKIEMVNYKPFAYGC